MNARIKLANMTGNITIIVLSIASLVILSSCSNDTSSGGVNPARYNVALASPSVTVTSNINTGGTEIYINDGDTSTTNSWQATSDGDYLLIEFSGPRIIESVDIVASRLSDYADFSMGVSSDNISYTVLDNQTSCSSYSLTASGYGCQFVTNQDALYFRFRILNNLNTPQIHEIVLMGTAPLL
jgi:hypothetical protein